MKRVILAIVALLLGCSQAPPSKAGSSLVAPFSLAATKVGANNYLYVLNAASFGEYSAGSVLTYSIGVSGEKTLLHAFDVPLYGTQIASNGTFVAAGFVGGQGAIRLYKIESDASLSPKYSVDFPSVGSLGGLSFFTHGGQDYLTVAAESNSVGGKVFVWRVESDKLVKVFVLPTDLSDYGRPLGLGYSNPVFQNGRFIVFPSNSVASLGSFSTLAKDFSVGSWDGTGDPRVFSAAVVDFSKLLSSGLLNSSIAYVPLIYQTGDTEDTKVYRTYFSASSTSQETICQSEFADSILVADDASGVVWKMNAWSGIPDAAFVGANLAEKLSFGKVTYEKYSLVGDVAPQTEFSTNVLAIRFFATQAVCRPVWLRMEVRPSGEGSARSWIQWRKVGAENSVPSSLEFSHRGVVSMFNILDYVYAVSYSHDSISTMKYDGTIFSEVF